MRIINLLIYEKIYMVNMTNMFMTEILEIRKTILFIVKEAKDKIQSAKNRTVGPNPNYKEIAELLDSALEILSLIKRGERI